MLLKIGAWSGACLSILALGQQLLTLVRKIQAVLDRLTQVEVLQERLLEDMAALNAGLKRFEMERQDRLQAERRLDKHLQGLGLAVEEMAAEVEELKQYAHVECGV